MLIPEIPDNSLTKEIREIVRLSELLCGEHDFEYGKRGIYDLLS